MKKLSMMLLTVVTMLVSLDVPVLASESNTLYDTIAKQAIRDDIRSEHVDSDTGIDFQDMYKDNNGLGVYTMASTLNDKYPIHYYRGEVDNNNVLFGGYCWQIVRTTETGGVKLIYNGKPNDKGTCSDTILDKELRSSQMYQSIYRNYSGYMYGTAIHGIENGYLYGHWYDIYNQKLVGWFNESGHYFSKEVTYKDGQYILDNPVQYNGEYAKFWGQYTCPSTEQTCTEVWYSDRGSYLAFQDGKTYDTVINELKSNQVKFGHDVEYRDGKYTLVDISQHAIGLETIEDNAHYTCLTSESECEKVYYISEYQYDEELVLPITMTYYVFEKGLTVDDIVNELTHSTNEHDSELKTIIDTWYKNHFVKYTSYLEDTIWCDDRNVINWGSLDKESLLKGYDYGEGFAFRTGNIWRYDSGTSVATLSCTNPQDQFTVSTKNGNGKLTYPVGALTSDEAKFAGGFEVDTDSYFVELTLSMSKSTIDNAISYNLPYQNGALTEERLIVPYASAPPHDYFYAQPAISLKHNMAVKNGDGTPDNPFTVEEIPEEIPNTSDGFMNHTLIFGLSLMMLLLGLYINRKVRYEE